MSTEQQELLNTQSNAEEATKENSSDELFQKYPIKGSPYWAIGKEGKWRLHFGKYVLTEWLEGVNAVEKYMEENSYNIVLQTILCVQSESKEGIKQNQ